VDVLFGLPEERFSRPGAVAFGNFDGVHLGHRALLRKLRDAARAIDGQSVVITFDPHPLTVLDPPRAPQPIDTLRGRLLHLDEAGVDRVIVLGFDAELRDRSAHWFATEVLCRGGSAGLIVAGYDCRFGRGGDGDIELLRTVAAEHSARVELFRAISSDGAVVSSSRIRTLVAAGKVADAAQLLARPFALRGSVARGDAIGRTIGFPTANVEAPEQIQPGAGVYAVRLHVDGQMLPAVCNAGVRPTVTEGEQWRVEAHCLDFDGDLYGAEVSLEFITRIRHERRFAGLDALKEQIARDCRTARELLRV
jgi:riboflavin kinase / FMN adenylyltransferase